MKYDNSGFTSPNDKKEKDSHPDHKGSITIDGVGYWASGWDNTNETGPYVRWKFEKKGQKPAPKETPSKPSKSDPDFDSQEIPF